MTECYRLWESLFLKTIKPVLDGFVNKNIQNIFKIEFSQLSKKQNHNVIFIELFCRTILSLSTYINNNNSDIYNLVIKSFNVCFNEEYIIWDCDDQLMVEMANLCLSFIRSPKLWNDLDQEIQKKIFNVMKKASSYKPHENNWILFKCIIDIFLYKNKKINDITHVNRYLIDFEKQFYIGDGWYKDGNIFHMDYYNSFVILPFLIDIYKELNNVNQYNIIVKRIQRQSEFLERLISPDGTFPIFGRSMVYRTAIFHALVYSCYNNILPGTISYSQVRCGLTETIKNTFLNDDNFDKNGFLNIGFSSYQPELADSYSNTGSLYFSLLIFIPLGLPIEHIFWSDADKEWTQKRVWTSKGIIKRDKNIK